jgi:hydrogenase nickel incorporation protein HypA/HybF
MHEQSLVRNLLKQVDQIRRENNAQRVVEVRVEMGPLSGVEPSLLANAFDQLCCNDTVKTASLVIAQIDLLAECGSCGEQFEVRDFYFRCPTCGGNVKVLQGDELQLVSVSLESDERTKKTVA